ncbi:MAG: TonB-dependent receptor [Pseudomonadota bacterium]|nr:TonB-dependent receptor [Pseudomonadota bacterium]
MTENRVSWQRPPMNMSLAAAVALALGLAPPPSVGAEPSADAIQEIVVTANRREQNVLDVPYNISTVSGAALNNAGVTNLTDMARLLPGVTIPDLGPRANSSNSLIIIRGLNVNDPVNSAYLPWGSVPTVSTYIDDVPLYVNLKLSDIQRVEVLRGPQGTLYGSGAVGGTVKVLHNAPDLRKFSADVSSEVSKTSHAGTPSYDIHAVLNVPLNDQLGFRLFAGYESLAGFTSATNAVVYTANQQPVLADPANPLGSGLVHEKLSHVDDAISSSVRATLLWKAASWLDATVAFQRQDDHSNGFSQQTQGYNYETAKLVPKEPDHRIVDLGSMTLTADAGFATVTSSTSYSTNSDDNTYDESQFIVAFDQISPTLYGNYPRISSLFFTTSRDTSFTQELRLVSKEGGGWDYAAGAFFQHQTEHLLQRESVPGFASWSELPGSANAANSVVGSHYANFGDFLQFYNGGTRPSADIPVDNMFTYLRLSGFLDRAIYGELTRHITPQWQITGGARLFWQNFSQSLDSTIPNGGPLYSTLPLPEKLTDHFGTTLVDRQQSFRNHIFKLNSSYAIADQMRVYGTFSEGFRHGGINALPLGACIFCESPAIVPYRSDTVKNYEVGLKGATHWLRYSAAVYRVTWDDVQIQVFGQAGDPAVVNGKQARTQGLELELGAVLGAGWNLNLGYGLTNAKITHGFSVLDVVNGTSFTLVTGKPGDRLPYVPRQSITADLGFTRPLASTMALDAHLNAAYRSDVTTQLNSSILGYRQLGGFTTVNGSTGLSFGTGWHARLFVNNLTNARGVTSAGPLLRIYDDPRYRIENVTRPRTIGIGFDYRFE